MRHLFMSVLAAGSMLAAPVALAQTSIATTDIHMLVLGDKSKNGATITASEGQPVITTMAVSPRAVQLKKETKAGGLGDEIVLKEGEILFGRFDRTVWTYCGGGQLNAESRIASGAAMAVLTAGFSLLLEPMMDATRFRCLLDGDKDGVFESAWGGGAPQAESALVLFDMYKQNLSAPVAYERVDPRKGPATEAPIKWSKGRGATITFSLGVGGLTGQSASAQIPAPGAPATPVKVAGVKLKLVGYDAARNAVTVEIEEGFSDLYMRLSGRRVITTTYSYY
jgi:hypothetical protein